MKKFLLVIVFIVFVLPWPASAAPLVGGEKIRLEFSEPAVDPSLCATSNYLTIFTPNGNMPIYYTLCNVQIGRRKTDGSYDRQITYDYVQGGLSPYITWEATLTIIRPQTSPDIKGIAAFSSYLRYADNDFIADCDDPNNANAGRPVCFTNAAANQNFSGNGPDTYTLRGTGNLKITDDPGVISFRKSTNFVFNYKHRGGDFTVLETNNNPTFTVNIDRKARLYVAPLQLDFNTNGQTSSWVGIQNLFPHYDTGFTVSCTSVNAFSGLTFKCPTVVKDLEFFLLEAKTPPPPNTTWSADIVINATADPETIEVEQNPQTIRVTYTNPNPNPPPNTPPPEKGFCSSATLTANGSSTSVNVPSINGKATVTFNAQSVPTGLLFDWHGSDPDGQDPYNKKVDKSVADGQTNSIQTFTLSDPPGTTYRRSFLTRETNTLNSCTSNTVTITVTAGQTEEPPTPPGGCPPPGNACYNNPDGGCFYNGNWCGGNPPPPPPPGGGTASAARGNMQQVDCDDEGFCITAWRPLEPYAGSITWPKPLTLEDTLGRRAVGLKLDFGASSNFFGITQVQFDCTKDGTYEKTLDVDPWFATSGISDGICNYPNVGTYTAYARAITKSGSVAWCKGAPCDGTATINVTALPNPPTVDLSSSVEYFKTSGAVYTLHWTTQFATSCEAKAVPEDGRWKNTKTTLPSQQRLGNVNVTTAYTLTCTGPGGSVSDTEIICSETTGKCVFDGPPTVIQPNYCISISDLGVTVNWKYISVWQNSQTDYQLQIDDNSNFNSPEIDTKRVSSTSKSWSGGNGILKQNKTYYVRVKGWSGLIEYAWSAPASWDTPKHAYPQVNFNWSPIPPVANNQTAFSDQTQFLDGSNNQSSQHTWSWNFGDGGTSTVQNPNHTFTSAGTYNVAERATDKDGYTCSKTQSVTIPSRPTVTCPGCGGGGGVSGPPVVIQPDYCASGPSATVNWGYFDPGNSPQMFYQVQIDDNSNFNNIEVDSGKIRSSNPTYSSGQGVLQFNKTYFVRVKVWNSQDVDSLWSTTVNFTTPQHAYPQVNFGWSPSTPAPGQVVQFTDQTTFSGGGNHTWSWNFGDGGSVSTQNPSHTYVSAGNYLVNLTATDQDGFSCSILPPPGKTINVKTAIPTIKEVPPKP